MQVPLLDLAAERRELGGELDAALRRVVDAGAFIGGTEVAAFEAELAAFLGARRAVAVANGTDALEIALQALEIGPGDTVVTVPFTFAATLEAIVRAGATPRLIDVRDDDLTIDVDGVREVLAREPVKAIVPVHLYGQPADMEPLMRLAGEHGAAVIEDAAQAHGARCRIGGADRCAGTIGTVGCFSFYPTKNLGALGDAGALVTGREDLAERARRIGNHGEAAKYEHAIPDGRNSRLDALQAAALRVKLQRLEAWNDARRRAAARYAERLDGLPLRLPVERAASRCVYHQFVVRHPERDRLRAALSERGIATAVHYPLPLHLQRGFAGLGLSRGAFPVAERAAREVLSLPLYPQIGDAAIDLVAETLRRAFPSG